MASEDCAPGTAMCRAGTGTWRKTSHRDASSVGNCTAEPSTEWRSRGADVIVAKTTDYRGRALRPMIVQGHSLRRIDKRGVEWR